MQKPWRQRQASFAISPRQSLCTEAEAGPLSGRGHLIATYDHFLRSCAKTKALHQGRHAHHILITKGLEKTLILANLLLYVYGVCGALDEFHCLFFKMHRLKISSWNFAIKAQALQGYHSEALQFFAHMQHQGFLPNKHIVISLFTALTQHKALKAGMHIHACMCGCKFDMDVAMHTALIIMYGNCSELELARVEFDKVSQHDAMSWTSMIVVYAQHGRGEDALSLFDCMLREGVEPDKFTFMSALDGCASLGSLIKGMQVHFLITSSGLEVNVVVGSALVNMYGKCSSLEDAYRVFCDMEDQNLVSWNALIGSYSFNKRSSHAFRLFEQMLQEGTLPNKVTFLSIFDACFSIASKATGKQMHARIVGHACEQDIVIQTTLIEFYGNCDQFARACRIFAKMSECDDVSLISIVSACANCAAFLEGKLLHCYIICNVIEVNIFLGTSLINMYSKCGSVQDAQNVFDRMGDKNIVCWNAIIGAYCHNGCGKRALFLYEQMLIKKVKPDAVTFLAVLSACSHAGLLKEGCRCFVAMKRDFGIVPDADHYNCIIDLLGRSGRLNEAEEVMLRMPIEPSATSWTTLLSACRTEVDVMRAEQAAFHLSRMDPESAIPHIMLANTYATAKRANDVEMARERGLKNNLDADVRMLLKSLDGTGHTLKAQLFGV